MTLQNTRTYVTGVLTNSFTNKSSLDKISETEDGSMLFDGKEIKGGGFGNLTLVSPNSYSEEEIIIGSWTNGKPIYSKTVTVTPDTRDYSADLSTFGITNIDSIVECYGCRYNDSYASNIPLIFPTGMTNSYSVWADRTSLRINIGSSSPLYTCKVVIEYTKTTDSENSFDLGMISSSVLPNNKYLSYDMYSEDEILIGKWTNGKPIYRKTIYKDSVPSDDFAHNIPDIDRVIQSYGTAVANGVNVYNLPMVHSAGTQYQVGIWANATNIAIRYSSSNTTLTSIYITLEYTKTTDPEDSFNPDSLSNVAPLSDNYMIGGDVYSEEEVVVGKWINGKPVYRKVLTGLSLTVSAQDWGTLNYANDIEYPIYCAGMNTGKTIYTFVWYATSTTLRVLQTRTGGGTQTFPTLIIEYTKTTDTENSFKPEMLPSILVGGGSGEITYTDAEIEALNDEIFGGNS